MISFAHENFTRVRSEYAAFVHRYWDNSPENGDEDPLDFNWHVYHGLDTDGLLHLYVGRDDGRMVAAALYIVMMDIKRKTRKVATCDTFAVARDYRGKGVGRKLYAFVEAALIKLKVNEVQQGYREVYHTKPLFEKLGFKVIERIYAKKVG